MKICTSVKEVLKAVYGESVLITSRQRVSGGDINQACLLILSNGERAFLKTNEIRLTEMFSAEAAGLNALAQTKAIGIPRVLGAGTDEDENDSFLLMEYIEPTRMRPDYWECLGRELAQMHLAGTESLLRNGRYGFTMDNYIGRTAQKNAPMDSWIDFFRENRLERQIHLADSYLDQQDRRQFLRLLDNLEKYLIEPDKPALLHGDLWNGNVICGSDGKAWLIDPAVYVGCNEVDLSMTQLFGGFAPAFYDAYREVYPLPDGYADRKDLYNLYQLLNHVNLFGSIYLPEVRRILRRYT